MLLQFWNSTVRCDTRTDRNNGLTHRTKTLTIVGAETITHGPCGHSILKALHARLRAL
jgi:hypothetical protein